MRRSNISSLSVIALAVVAMAFVFGYLRVEAQAPVGSGFTYQGRMFDASNAPVQGTCDMALRLYDHDAGGAQIGATVTLTSVAMTDGYFDVTPDFGAPSFNGDARWLEIEAACPPGAGSTTFPRQVINVVPYAMYALNSAITSTVYVTEAVYYTPTYHLQGWETITGTPGTYTPTVHTQDWGTITGQPEEYTPTYHLQGWETITGTPGTYTPTAHTQDWDTITGQPAEYTPTAHTQDWGTITGPPSTYTPTLHDMITAHTYSGGSALDVFGLSAASTITRITPSSNPGATANILASNSTGGLTLAGKLSYNESDWTGGNVTYVPLNANIQTYINAAIAGDTLILASGEYIITSTITINKQLNIVGQGNAGFLTNPVTAGHGTLISSSTAGVTGVLITSSNVRVAHLSINLTGNTSLGVDTSANLTGLVFTNIDVIVNCSGWAAGFTVHSSDIVMRNLTFYVTSINFGATGVWFYNDSSTTKDAVADCFNITGIVKGASISAFGFAADNENVAHTLTLNMSNSSVIVLSGTPLDVAIASTSTQTGSPVTNNSTVNSFLCTLNGHDYDAQQNGTNVLALGGSVLVNNRVSGTVTYRATIASGTGVFGGTLTAGSGSLTDSSGLISFGNNNLTTTGIFTHTQAWTTITGQPSTYTPTAHTQAWSTITSQPSTYTSTAHMHDVTTITPSLGLIGNGTEEYQYVTVSSHNTGHQPIYSTGYLDIAKDETLTVNDSLTVGTLTSGRMLYTSAANTIDDTNNAMLDASGNAYFASTLKIATTGEAARLNVNRPTDGAIANFDVSLNKFGWIATQVSGVDKGYLAWNFNDVGSALGTSMHVINTQGKLHMRDNTNTGLTISGGNVGIGVVEPNNFILQTAGNIGPNVSNTYDLGSAGNYWATIHYHTLTSHSLSVFSTTVTLQNGRDVSCLDALKEIKADPTKKVKGMPHMDYATIPSIALNTAPWFYNGSTLEKNGEDGADLDMMVSLTLCAARELDVKSTALDNRMSDFEKRLADLELKVP